MNTKPQKYLQRNNGSIELLPGDMVWRRCAKLFFSRGSNVEYTGQVAALLYLGKKMVDGRLVFTAFSIRGADLIWTDWKYTIVKNNFQAKLNIGTIKAATKKMTNQVNGSSQYHAAMNKGVLNKEYNIQQELYITTSSYMKSMEFAKSGCRLTDMKGWPTGSIRWWGTNVLGINSQQNVIANKISDNTELVTYLRKVSLARTNKMLFGAAKKGRPTGAVKKGLESINQEYIAPGILPDNDQTPLMDSRVFASPEIKEIIDNAANNHFASGTDLGVNWVKLLDPNFIGPYEVILNQQIHPAMLKDSTIIFDHHMRPIYMTVARDTEHPTKAVLKITGDSQRSLGLYVINYRDNLLDWARRGNAGTLTSIAVDYNRVTQPVPELEEDDYLELIDADEEEYDEDIDEEEVNPDVMTFRVMPPDVDAPILVEYNYESGDLSVYDLRNTHRGPIHKRPALRRLTKSRLKEEYITSISWRTVIDNSAERAITFVSGSGIRYSALYRGWNGHLLVSNRDTRETLLRKTIAHNLKDHDVIVWLDNNLFDLQTLQYTFRSGKPPIKLIYNPNDGRVEASFNNVKVADLNISPGLSNGRVIEWADGKNWVSAIRDAGINLDSDPSPQSDDTITLRRPLFGDNSELRAEYRKSSGDITVTHIKMAGTFMQSKKALLNANIGPDIPISAIHDILNGVDPNAGETPVIGPIWNHTWFLSSGSKLTSTYNASTGRFVVREINSEGISTTIKNTQIQRNLSDVQVYEKLADVGQDVE